MANNVTDNAAAQRYEMDVGGKSAFVTYRRAAGVVTLLHAEVPAELNGRGLGSQLVRGTLELAREQGYKVVPRCPFIAHYAMRHAEFRDLIVAPSTGP